MKFLKTWTRAVESADAEGIKATIPEYDPPRCYNDARIKYFLDKFKLNFFRLSDGVVTEAHNWNSAFFWREHDVFCEICNTLDKKPAFFAVIYGGDYFAKFKKTLYHHMKEYHPEIVR